MKDVNDSQYKVNRSLFIKFSIITLIAVFSSIFFSWIYTTYYYKKPFIISNEVCFLRCFLSFVFFEFVFIHFILDINKMYKFIFKYRYWIALALLGFFILFELSGSSIAEWLKYWEDTLSQGQGTNTLFGIPRAVRSDEWAVNTPIALSQAYNMKGKFPYFGDVTRASLTDMFIVYGQPVLDIAVIFRPFHWGYLLFGAARGLSFFWYGRLIALFLVTFEFSRLISKDNKILSAIAAVLISFAPIVQWWFAVNGIAEILIFGQLILLLIYNYIKTDNYKRRLIYALIFVICAGGYILVFYPAWQISAAYVWLAFFIWIIIEYRKDFKFSKYDLFIFVLCLILLFSGLGYILLKSKDTIKAVMETVYPGKRFELGGGGISFYINHLTNIFQPFKNSELNFCKQAVFLDFFPICYILSFYVLFVEKNKDRLLKILLIVGIFLNLWMLFGLNALLAKVTLLFCVPPKRGYFAVGLINIFILIRTLTLIKEFMSRKGCLMLSVILSIFFSVIAKIYFDVYMTKSMILILFFVLCLGFYLLLMAYKSNYKKLLLLYSVLVVGFTGMCVNPIEKGLDSIYNNVLMDAIKDINKKEDGIWMVEGGGFPIPNYPIMAGVSTLNSTNVYPDLEKWHKIDPQGQYEDIYNRYAHIVINLIKKDESSFELIQTDLFKLYLDVFDLSKLDVKYIISKNNLEWLNNGIEFNRLYDDKGYKIYKVDYSDIKEYKPISSKDLIEVMEKEIEASPNIFAEICFDTIKNYIHDLEISGWAYVPNYDCENQDVYIEVKNDDGYIFLYNAFEKMRNDVGDVFGSSLYNRSGLFGVIDINEIHSGRNVITVIIKNGEEVFRSEKSYEFEK